MGEHLTTRTDKSGAVHEEEMHCSTLYLVWPPAALTVTVDFDHPFVQGHIIPFLLVTCLSNLFSLSQLLNLVMLFQIFTHVKFAENELS